MHFFYGDLEKSLIGYFIFSLACAMLGLLVIVSDLCLYYLQGGSRLGLEYRYPKKYPLMLFTYTVGAGAVGFLGLSILVLNFHVMGAAVDGIGWPVILTRMLASTEKKVIEQKKEEE